MNDYSKESKRYASRENVLQYIVYFISVIVFVVFTLSSKAFLTPANMIGMLIDSTPLLCAAIGVTFVLLFGQLDLSVGSLILGSGTFTLILLRGMELPPIVYFILALFFGALLGFANGLLIVRVRLNPWLVTLATMLIFRGISLLLTKATTVMVPESITNLRNVKALGIPVFVLVAYLVLLISQFFLNYTVLGRKLMIVGCNKNNAKKIGIDVNSITYLVYSLCGFMCGLAAIMVMINLGTFMPTTGRNYEFFTITAVVLGGTSLLGGKGSVFPRTLVGVLIYAVLENGLSIIGTSPYIFGVVRGLLILFTMSLDAQLNTLQKKVAG